MPSHRKVEEILALGYDTKEFKHKPRQKKVKYKGQEVLAERGDQII